VSREQPNPLDGMSWEERFMAAFAALLVMESRAERAERGLIQLGKSHSQVIAELQATEALYKAVQGISGRP
jgi:hypothetical protein